MTQPIQLGYAIRGVPKLGEIDAYIKQIGLLKKGVNNFCLRPGFEPGVSYFRTVGYQLRH